MKITREFFVSSVTLSGAEKAPITIKMVGGNGEHATATINAEVSAEFGIEKPADLVGQSLICEFKSHVIPIVSKLIARKIQRAVGQMNWDKVKINDLLWQAEKIDKTTNWTYMLPPFKEESVVRKLILNTPSGGGMHFSPLPFPFYDITVNLTEGEYKNCVKLPANAVFGVTFKLKK